MLKYHQSGLSVALVEELVVIKKQGLLFFAIKMHKKNSDNLTKQFENIFLKINKSTVTIFRTAYYISKNNRPFSDHSKLLELQNINGINTGITLQSRFSCTQIIAPYIYENERKNCE